MKSQSISLSLRNSDLLGNVSQVSIRHDRTTIDTLKFESDEEAINKYCELIGIKFHTNEDEPINEPDKNQSELFEEDTSGVPNDEKAFFNQEIIDYVNLNPDKKGVKSARHLNAKYGVKLKQTEYDEILKGL